MICQQSGVTEIERDNSFASVKVAYSLDYGKKVNHSPKYESKAAESSILK